MAIFSSTQPSLRARVLPRFPANVIAGTGITITKNGATYTFALSPITELPLSGLVDIPANTVLGRDGGGTGAVQTLTAASGLGFTGGGALQLVPNQRIRALPFTIVSTGALTTGVKGDLYVPFACTITQVTLLADAALVGSAFTMEILKDTYANYPPTTPADRITASDPPTILVGQAKGQNTTMTGWTTTIAAGDTLRFNITATNTITRVQINIDVTTV